MITESDACEIIQLAMKAGIGVRLDGGWGIEIDCIEPASQLAFHLGYEHDENDVHDVMLLCEKYGFDVPDEYRE